MSSSSSKDMAWAAGQLRDKLQRRPDQLHALADAGLLDEEVIELLVSFKRHWPEIRDPSKDDPGRAWETETWQRIAEKNISKNIRQAVRDGEIAVVKHAVGMISQETDISAIKVIERLGRWIEREAGITYLAGHMGMGKTDFALLLAEIWESRTEGEVASNIQSCEETKSITSQADLEDWLADTAGDKLFIMDEASSHASGYSKDAHNVEAQLSGMIKLIRKEDAAMILIGHTGKDVHPDVRRLSDYVEKEDKKDAAVFEDVQEGEGEDKKFQLTGIPATSWSYDTKESSYWEWATEEDDDGPDLKDLAARIYNAREDIEGTWLEQFFPFSKSTIYDRARELRQAA